jgi:hypothetical protein
VQRVNDLLRQYYEYVNCSGRFKDMTTGECYEESLLIKNEIALLKEEFKDFVELYKILDEFCKEEFNPLGWVKAKKDEKN